MVFHIKFSCLRFKSKKTAPETDQFDDSLSTASTIAPSKSALDSFLAAFSTDKFTNDPMRTTKYPEVVGSYYDPMSCARPGNITHVGFDCTNTGA
ncbi:hypothetical protein BDF21DRAFT_430128 [Thamnidium elegans]|uniref:Uncharacterized protein n=1 Tax=Thamnidium elegans TaxID=101142 RepID=A0A8H7SR30_9FUNG|nr:hypothetical protein INT48_005837 [Thamnidium elegans]KAI8058854.1 hypothetical protein BDF21DRAFT_430128 [Thamnidium elegans]